MAGFRFTSCYNVQNNCVWVMQSSGCRGACDNIRIGATTPETPHYTDALFSNWGCSIQEARMKPKPRQWLEKSLKLLLTICRTLHLYGLLCYISVAIEKTVAKLWTELCKVSQSSFVCLQYFDSYPSGPTGFQAIGFSIDPPAPYILARGSTVRVLSCLLNAVRFPSR